MLVELWITKISTENEAKRTLGPAYKELDFNDHPITTIRIPLDINFENKLISIN